MQMKNIEHFEHELTYILELKYQSEEDDSVKSKAINLCRAFIVEIYQYVEKNELDRQMECGLTQCLQAIIE